VALLQPTDTVYNVDYKDIMYDITAGSVSFYITARENVNQYNIAGESTSSTVSTEITERITVPNAFTPDNDLLNDLFLPILSFTPVKYRLIITDRRNNTIFETTDHLLPWDGTKGGSVLPEGVYLWYLNTTSPSGKSFSRTGTISIVRNR
jgi:gliding motility-associated-like protein